MSQLKVNSIIPVAGVPTGGGGGIIQIVEVIKTAKQSIQSQTPIDITGFEATITPTSTSSKILIETTITACCHASGVLNIWRQIGGNSYGQLTDYRGDADGNRERATMHIGQTQTANTVSRAMTILDSPSTTSAVKYKWQAGTPYNAGYVMTINSSVEDANSNYYPRTISTIRLMEVSA